MKKLEIAKEKWKMEHLLRSDTIIKVYLKIAQNVSELSRCNRSKVGAIIVKSTNIISYGYNGTPAGFCNDCEVDLCFKCVV